MFQKLKLIQSEPMYHPLPSDAGISGISNQVESISLGACGTSAASRSEKKNYSLRYTTIAAAKYKDGVVMGSDTWELTGFYIESWNTNKFYALSNKIYCGAECIFGNLFDFIDYMSSSVMEYEAIEESESPVRVTAELARGLIYNRGDPLGISVIISGYDNVFGPSVYLVDTCGYLCEREWMAIGAGKAYALRVLESLWRDNMSEEDCTRLVEKSVAFSMQKGSTSGGNIHIIIINNAGVREYTISRGRAGNPVP